MIVTFLAHLRAQWAGFLALFLVLTGGIAYGANTVFSSDIVDGEVKAPDIAAGAVLSGEVANNQIKSADVRDDTLAGGGLTGADINEFSLEEVPAAADADFAQTALNAFNAIGAEDANNLDGLDSSDFVRSGGASFTSAGLNDTGSDGICTATNVWQDYKPNEFTEVGYWRDSSGIVHLRGTAIGCGNPPSIDGPPALALSLPPGYGPARTEIVTVPGLGLDGDGNVHIQPGAVQVVGPRANDMLVSFGGVTFRCGPSGQGGCP